MRILLGYIGPGGATTLAQTALTDNTKPYRAVYETSQAFFNQYSALAKRCEMKPACVMPFAGLIDMVVCRTKPMTRSKQH